MWNRHFGDGEKNIGEAEEIRRADQMEKTSVLMCTSAFVWVAYKEVLAEQTLSRALLIKYSYGAGFPRSPLEKLKSSYV